MKLSKLLKRLFIRNTEPVVIEEPMKRTVLGRPVILVITKHGWRLKFVQPEILKESADTPKQEGE